MSEKRIRNNKKRRQVQLKRKILISSFTCMLVLLCAITFGSFFVKANSSKNQSFKYYTSIQVAPGETLWSIANKYMDTNYDSVFTYINEVMEMNHLKKEEIHTGEYLIVPYYSSKFVS